MFTDKSPQGRDRLGFLESDRTNTLNLPPDAQLLPEIAKNIEAAMQTGKTTEVRVACAVFLSQASRFYEVPKCGVRVLAARPLKGREWVTELFGDYDPTTMLMRLWMRTARKKAITSFGTFLSTLCHLCGAEIYVAFAVGREWGQVFGSARTPHKFLVQRLRRKSMM
ncbi:MAG: hypothetical protein ACLP07_03050, partial [Terracidiphilus sp.]